jgi:hypothetical protein
VLGVEAESIRIIVTDSDDVEVYNELIYLDCVEDEPEDMVKLDLPEASGGTLTVGVTHNSGIAKLGEIVIGNKFYLGSMKYSPEISIQDYSIKTTDVFGNYTIVERAYSKKLSCDIRIDNDDLDVVYNKLVEYRATPLVWVGSEDYGSLIIYGFCKDFEMVVPYISYSDCSLEIEGLT